MAVRTTFWISLTFTVLVTLALLQAVAGEHNHEEDDDVPEDVDFPDDPEPTGLRVVGKVQSPTFIYVLRLLEIITGSEGPITHRVARGTGEGYPESPAPAPAPPPSGRGTSASYSNYYDFLINEGSYKFWAAFEVGTAVLLVYSAFAALYYARYTYYTNVDYSDYDDYFFRRRSGRSVNKASPTTAPFAGMSSSQYQRVLDAIDGNTFKEKS